MADDVVQPGSVDRRTFLGKAALGAAGVAVTAAACDGPGADGGPAVRTRANVQWRLASSFPPSLDALYGSATRLTETIERLTDGRFRIQPYSANEIVPALQVMDAVQQGTVQVGHSPGYYYNGKNEALSFDTGVPFGLTSRQQSAWLNEGGGLDLMRDLYDDFGIINFPGGNTGAQMGGWFKREVNSLSDLRGLKMRIPGPGGAVMNRLGVTVQVLGGGDIYPALERGAIDATEWVGPYDDEKLGFHRAARFYYYPGWWEPGPSMTFMVNRQAWDQLSKEYQDAFEIAAAYAAQSTQIIYDTRNPAALERLIAGGTQMRRFSDDIMQGASRASQEIHDQYAGRDAMYKKVYEAFRKFRDDSNKWFATTEQEFSRFMLARPNA